MAIDFDSIPPPFKWLALSAALFVSGLITRIIGEVLEEKERRKLQRTSNTYTGRNWMKPRPKTWAETLEETKEERRQEESQRNAETFQLSDEELEKLRPKRKKPPEEPTKEEQ